MGNDEYGRLYATRWIRLKPEMLPATAFFFSHLSLEASSFLEMGRMTSHQINPAIIGAGQSGEILYGNRGIGNTS